MSRQPKLSVGPLIAGVVLAGVLPGAFDAVPLTSRTTRLFLGQQIQCTQCHDHPLVPDWKQEHFFGLKSFFARTFDNGGFVAEREVGVVKFLTTKGVSRDARYRMVPDVRNDHPPFHYPPMLIRQSRDRRERLQDSCVSGARRFLRRSALHQNA